MKRNILLVLMFIIAIDLQALKWCEKNAFCIERTNVYGKIFSGLNLLQNTSINGNTTTYQPGYIAAATLGYRWYCGLRLEAEYAFRRNSISTINFVGQGSSNNGYYHNSSYMANIVWDVPLSSVGCLFWNAKPFLGAGVGYDFQQIRSSNSLVIFRQNWPHLSWQLMGGFTYPLFCKTEMTLEYQFHQGNTHFYNHALGLGLIYHFGS